MKYCDKCKINVRGRTKHCPLCQGSLTGESDEVMYPKIATVLEKHMMFVKLLILGTVAAGAAAAAVNLILPQTGIWSLFVLLGIACFWISLATAFKRRNNLPKNITSQVVIISLLCILWDCITGWRGWSVDYVLPIACCAGMVSLGILARVLPLPRGDYLVCMVIDVIFGNVPLVLYLTGTAKVAVPSVICAALSVVAFAFILLFEGGDIKEEIIKRIHI